jgi:hypothetical protein
MSESASSSLDTTSTTPTAKPAQKFSGCAEAKAAGVSMIPRTDPRYALKLDRDRDGFACDAHGDPPTPTTTRKTPAATSSTMSTAPSSTTTPAPSMSASTTPTTTSAPPIKPASDVLGS